MNSSNKNQFPSYLDAGKTNYEIYKYINFDPIPNKGFYDEYLFTRITEPSQKSPNPEPEKNANFDENLFTELFFKNTNSKNSCEIPQVYSQNEEYCKKIEVSPNDFTRISEEIEYPSKERLLEDLERKLREKNRNSGSLQIHMKIMKKKIAKKKKSYDYKNGLKIIGQKVISFIEKGFFERENDNVLERLIIEANKDLTEKISIDMMKNWMNEQEIKKKYTKLTTFREIWRRNSKENIDENEKKIEVYKEVLTKITKKFLEEDIYSIIIANNGSKRIEKIEYMMAYMEVVPKMLRGIENPEEFMNLE